MSRCRASLIISMWFMEFWSFIQEELDRKVEIYIRKVRKCRKNRKITGILSELARGSRQLFQNTYRKHDQRMGDSTAICKRAIFDFFWFRYPHIVLCRWVRNGPISSLTNFYIYKILLPWLKEKKTKEATADSYAWDNYSFLHKVWQSNLERSLGYLRFYENSWLAKSESNRDLLMTSYSRHYSTSNSRRDFHLFFSFLGYSIGNVFRTSQKVSLAALSFIIISFDNDSYLA
jgi:hypothetical protein